MNIWIVYEYLDLVVDDQAVWLRCCSDALLVVLAVGGDVTRNWREMLVRLGLNRKPTSADFV